MSDPFKHTAGPRDARVMIIGEAWGAEEDFLKQPFVGESGKELFRMLFQAWPQVGEALQPDILDAMQRGNAWVSLRDRWLREASVCLTNVLALRPPDNKMEALCGKKAEVGEGYNLPHIKQGQYLKPEIALPNLARLRDEILHCKPNIILALGNTATWATLHSTSIGSIRGAIASGNPKGVCPNCKILPTYHPAGVLRNWSWRTIVVTDLMKALRESEFPEIRRPQRFVLIPQTIAEAQAWASEALSHASILSADIETGWKSIKCIGFSYQNSRAMVVPFYSSGSVSGNYWPDLGSELAAWDVVKRLLEAPITKLGQNFIYDLQYIWRMGIRPRQCTEDTMLLHHSLFPEMPKGLGFLGSIYTNEASWKLMRHEESTKRDD